LSDLEFFYESLLTGFPDLSKEKFVLELLREGLEDRGCGLALCEQEDMILGRVSVQEGLIVLRGNHRDKTLHLLCRK
jgi:hypothetical protein